MLLHIVLLISLGLVELRSKFDTLGFIDKKATPFPLPIPYVFKDKLDDDPKFLPWKNEEKAYVERVLQRINNDLKKGSTKCTKNWFRPATDADGDQVINIIKYTGLSCMSPFGLPGSLVSSIVNLPGEKGCLTWDSIVHELGHRLGLHHEHNRPDRNTYIDRLDPKKNPIVEEDTSMVLSDFDTGSIMFYNQMNFRTALGQQTSWNFTPRDLEAIHLFYSDCQETIDTAVPVCVASSPLGATGHGQPLTVVFSVNLPGNNPATLVSLTEMPQIKADQPVGSKLATPNSIKVVFTPTPDMVGKQQVITAVFGNGNQRATCSQTITVMEFPVLIEECFGYNAKDKANVCSGHGTCTKQDVCICVLPFRGKACEADATSDGLDRIYQSIPENREKITLANVVDSTETWDFNWPNNNVKEFSFVQIDLPLQVKGVDWENIDKPGDGSLPKTFTVEWQEEDGTVLSASPPFTQLSNVQMYGNIWGGTFLVPTRQIIPSKGKLRIFNGDGVTWGQTTEPVVRGAAKNNAHFVFDILGAIICKDGYFGAKCENTCPGGAGFAQCFGNGLCHDGNIGDGKCECFSNKYDASTGCEKCIQGWTGPRCATQIAARLIVNPTNGLIISRSGTSSRFTVALGSAPTGNVEVTITPSRTGITVNPQKLNFNANTGTVPQTVAVTGTAAGDAGDQPFTIALAVTNTADDSYKNVIADTKGSNRDDIVDACKGIVCPAPTQCQQSTYCVKQTGVCSFVAKPNGVTCNDGNPVTVEDACRDGVCVGIDKCKGVTCRPRGPCQSNGICDVNTGECSVVNLPDGVNCDVRDASSKCSNGVCVKTQVSQLCANVVCNTTDTCKFPGICNANTGVCSALTNKPDGSLCDDLNSSTVNDKCTAGVCAGVNLCATVTCPRTQCSDSTCDRTTGRCLSKAVNESTTCDDNNPNTENDKCVFGTCIGRPRSNATNPTAPQGWTCSAGFYADGHCNCGCGIFDPDCGSCKDTTSCSTGGCQVQFNGTNYGFAYCMNDTLTQCDICSFHPCENNGKCKPIDNNGIPDYECSCPVGFIGINCEGRACESNPCNNEGVCIVGTDGEPICVCNPPYSGDRCEILDIPEGWTCVSTRYLDGHCDCGCGIPDPECSWCQSQCPTGCQVYSTSDNFTNGAYCATDLVNVRRCPNVTQPKPPPNWICLASSYGDGICDCGCSAVDVDCASCNANNCCHRTRYYVSDLIKPFTYPDIYGYCDDNNSVVECSMNPCDPNPCGDGHICSVGPNKTAICMCGPGLVEPNCDNPCNKTSCGKGQCVFDTEQAGCELRNPSSCVRCECSPGFFGDKCDTEVGSVVVPTGWTCDSKLYTDGQCNCGCGVPDPACRFCSCSTKQVGCTVTDKSGASQTNAICPNDKVLVCATLTASSDPASVPFNTNMSLSVKPGTELCYSPGMVQNIACDNGSCNQGKKFSASNVNVVITASGDHSLASCVGQRTSIPLFVKTILQPKAQVSLIGTGNPPTESTLKTSLCSALVSIPCDSINVLQVKSVQSASSFKFKFQATGWEAQVVVSNAKSVATVAASLNDAAKTKSSPLAVLGTLAATARAASSGSASNPVFSNNGTTLIINSTSSDFLCLSLNPSVIPVCGATNCTSGNTTFGFISTIQVPPANATVWAIGCSTQGNSNITSYTVPVIPPTPKPALRLHVSIKNCPTSKCDPVPASECGEGCYLIYFNNEP